MVFCLCPSLSNITPKLSKYDVSMIGQHHPVCGHFADSAMLNARRRSTDIVHNIAAWASQLQESRNHGHLPQIISTSMPILARYYPRVPVSVGSNIGTTKVPS